MIVINPPVITAKDRFSILSSTIEIDGAEERLWYKFPQKFQQYLVTENLDGFLVGLLFLGLRSGKDITLKAPVSARLLYTINHYLIPALVLANPKFHKINILASGVNNKDLNAGKVAGTGMSCGIDSFASYYDHNNEVDSFGISYFTFFNVGSHLDFGGVKAREIYQNRLRSVSEFAKKEGKEVISVDSNLSEILKMNFQQTHSLRSISCVLQLQKLFKNYYYSSAYRFDHFKLNAEDTSDSDIFNLQMLSTESTNLFASAAQFSRVERTLMVAEHPGTYDKLDVCTAPMLNGPYINCSICYKCLRTQLTLETGGKLHLYGNVFDIIKYKKYKDKYIGKLLLKKKKSPLDKEVIAFLKNEKIIFSLKAYYYAITSILNSPKKKIIISIKSLINNRPTLGK